MSKKPDPEPAPKSVPDDLDGLVEHLVRMPGLPVTFSFDPEWGGWEVDAGGAGGGTASTFTGIVGVLQEILEPQENFNA